MKNRSFLFVLTLTAAVISSLVAGCGTTDLNKKTVRVYQASGSGRKLGIVQDPVTGQYSLGYQSVVAGAMIVPVTITTTSNGAVNVVVPNATMSLEIGAKPVFFGSAAQTMTFAVGDLAVETMLGGAHPPINDPYWPNSATGVVTNLPLAGQLTPTVTTATIQTITGTNGVSQSLTNISQMPIVIKP